MQILTKVLIKEWFKILFGVISVLFLLITTADLINGFLQGKEFSRVILEYSLKMPELMGRIFPISCLVATLFLLNKLKAHSELIAILSSGYSYLKFYLTIGLCALFVVAIQFINLGFLEPYANKIKRAEIQKSRLSEGKYLTRSSLEGGKFWYRSQNYFSSFTFFDKKSMTINNLEIFYFGSDSKSTKIIKAKSASYLGDSKWSLSDVSKISNLNGSDFPIISYQAQDQAKLDEAPEDLKEFEADLTTLDYLKLYNFISKLKKSEINITEYEVMLLNKVSLSFVCLIFSLLPLSSLFNPNRRNSSFGKIAVQTLLISFLFWGSYSSIIAMGNEGKIHPLLATSFIPLAFLSFVIWTFWKNRKLAI